MDRLDEDDVVRNDVFNILRSFSSMFTNPLMLFNSTGRRSIRVLIGLGLSVLGILLLTLLIQNLLKLLARFSNRAILFASS